MDQTGLEFNFVFCVFCKNKNSSHCHLDIIQKTEKDRWENIEQHHLHRSGRRLTSLCDSSVRFVEKSHGSSCFSVTHLINFETFLHVSKIQGEITISEEFVELLSFDFSTEYNRFLPASCSNSIRNLDSGDDPYGEKFHANCGWTRVSRS